MSRPVCIMSRVRARARAVGSQIARVRARASPFSSPLLVSLENGNYAGAVIASNAVFAEERRNLPEESRDPARFVTFSRDGKIRANRIRTPSDACDVLSSARSSLLPAKIPRDTVYNEINENFVETH